MLHFAHGEFEGGAFEGEGAAVAPLAAGDAFEAIVLVRRGGLIGGDEGVEEGLEFGGVFAGEDEGEGAGAVFEAVEADGGFALVGNGSAGEGSVTAGGLDLRGGPVGGR